MSAGCYHKGIANDNKNGVRNDEYLFKTDSDSLLCLPGTKGLQTVKTKWGKTTYVELENKPIQGKVQIHKTAADNNAITGHLKGDGLKDAKFTVYDSDGKKVTVLRTDSKGFAESDWLRYGKYTMKETTSPLYFLLSDEMISFEIRKDGEIVEIERENKSTALQTHVDT